MTTVIKLDAKLAGAASDAIEGIAKALYLRPGIRVVGIVELAHVERTEPAPDEDKDPTVKLAIKHLEIANGDQEEPLRKAMRALKVGRTAYGTLTEDGDIELSKETLRLTGDLLVSVEAARLRAAIAHWARYAQQGTTTQLTASQAMQELKTVADGLYAALGWSDERA